MRVVDRAGIQSGAVAIQIKVEFLASKALMAVCDAHRMLSVFGGDEVLVGVDEDILIHTGYFIMIRRVAQVLKPLKSLVFPIHSMIKS